MNKLKYFIKKYLAHFSYFYTYLRQKLFIALALSMLVGLLDGLGLAMFLPLLQMVDTGAEANAEGLGNLRFIVDIMEYWGLSLTLYTVLLAILFFFVLKGIAKFAESYYRVLVQQYFMKRIRAESVLKLSNYKYSAFVKTNSGRIQNTLSGEVGRVALANNSYFAAIQAGVLVLVYFVLAFFTNPQFAVLVGIGGVIINSLYRQIYTKTKATSRKITSVGHEFQDQLLQNVIYFKYLKATNLIKVYANKLLRTVEEIEANNKKIGLYNSILVATREPLVVIVVVAVIIVQVSYFSESLALIILSLLFFYRSLTFLMAFQTHWNQFLNVSGSLENMSEFISELSDAQDKEGSKEIKAFSDAIQLENLSFSYGQATILKDINLLIRKNETVAFVGESGSGKTSLVNVLAGLLPVEQGCMYVDGLANRDISISSYQKRIGYITQEPVVFSDTIFNNVTFWAEDTPENKKRFWEAIRKAAIEDFVLSLPEQEGAHLGNNGVLISGGQKQRLSIARELYKDIDILIMDEATSALDSETEKVIQENINSLKGKYTILIVAHRLSTIREADSVVLLSKGEIKEVGNFAQLIESSERFRRMAAIQEV